MPSLTEDHRHTMQPTTQRRKVRRRSKPRSSSSSSQKAPPSSSSAATTTATTSSSHKISGVVAVSTVFVVLLLIGFNVLFFLSLQQQEQLVQKPLLRSSSSSASSSSSWLTAEELKHPFNQDETASRTHHLIVVAGHSVIISGHLQDANVDEKDWFLLDYQRQRGLPQAIVAHIRKGIEICHDDPDSLLVFSGGETRASTGPITEGASYFHVADAMHLWPSSTSATTTTTATNSSDASSSDAQKQEEDQQDENEDAAAVDTTSVRARTVTEEYATDSFQNLLFSICRFHEVTGHYPTKITVVSFTFKQQRFEQMHAKALQWPASDFRYIGIDPSPEDHTGFDLRASQKGELENSVVGFRSDPYGCHTPVLQEKRQQRNPFKRTPPYELTCPEIKELLHYCGPELISKDKVPWGRRDNHHR